MRYFKDITKFYVWRINPSGTIEFRGGIEEQWEPAIILNTIALIEQNVNEGKLKETSTDPFKEYDCLHDL